MSTRFSSCLLALAIALAGSGLAGCGNDRPAAAAEDGGGAGAGSAGLACTAMGYPCALADVPTDLLEAGESLADETLARLAGGEGTREILDWLAGQESIVEAEGDEAVIVFRLDGAPPVWILRAGSLAHNLQAATAPAAAPARHVPLALEAMVGATHGSLRTGAAAGAPAAWATATSGSSAPGVVVGADPASKSALVLSPFLHQFGAFDEGSQVADLLVATRGYPGNVLYRKNETTDSRQVTLADFRGWGAYDVIHLSTHGNTYCGTAGCEQMINTGIVYESLDELLELSVQFSGIGIYQSRIEGETASYVALGADFFASEYPGGLDNTLIYFSACRSFGNFGGQDNSRIADALQGSTSVFLGWSDVTNSGDAKATSAALYSALAVDGLPVDQAYRALGDLGVSNGVYEGVPYASRLILGLRPAGGDLRIREVVTLLDPLTAVALGNGDTVAIDGTAADGAVDRLPYRVRVDGVRAEDAAKFDVHLSVQGGDPVDLGTASVGEQVDEFSREFAGLVDLGFDAQEGQEIDLRAWSDLPDEGISEHSVPVTLSAKTPFELRFCSTMDFSWTGVGSTHAEVLAKVNLGPRSGADRYSAGPQALRYVTFVRTVEDSEGCTITADLTDGTLAVPDSLIRIANGGVAGETEIVVIPDGLREVNRIQCDTTTTEFGTTEWVAAWRSFHSGVLAGAEDEYDPEREGWVIGHWEAADGEGVCADPEPPTVPGAVPGRLLARRSYVRSAPGPEAATSFAEHTVLEIRSQPRPP